MVIDSNNINPTQPGKSSGGKDSAALDKRTGAQAAGSQASDASAATSVSKDTVELSSQAQNLGQLREALAAQPDVDEARVAKIRSAIADGSYQIEPNRIADSIVRSDSSF